MTDRPIEQQLRAWYAVQVPVTEGAPSALRAGVVAIPRDVVVRPVQLGGQRRLALLAAAVLATIIGGWLLGGIGRQPTPSPSPTKTAGPTAPPTPIDTTSQTQQAPAGIFAAVRMARAVSDTVAWAATPDGLYRTPDAGQTWQAVQPLGWALPADAAFVDAETAYVPLEDGVTIAVTHDAGQTWTSRSVPVDAGAGLASFSFNSAASGYVTFYDPAHYDKPDGTGLLVFGTSDGGATWVGPAHGLQPAFRNKMPKVSAAHGSPFLVSTAAQTEGQPFENWFYTSEDGGATWARLPFPSGALAPKNDLKAVGAIMRGPDGHLLVAPDLEGASEAQVVYRNGDEPSSWSELAQAPSSSSASVQFVSATTWVVTTFGAPSTIESTTDSGTHWRAIDSSLVFQTRNVTWASTETGIAWSTCPAFVSNSCSGSGTGAVFITTDGGKTWRATR